MADHCPKGLNGFLLRQVAFRHWKAAPWQSMLLVAILSLGIAVFFSIRLANQAALASFRNFTDLITKESDWIIQAPAGLLPESVLPELRDALNPQPVHILPVLETTGGRPQVNPDTPIGSAETFQILGLDLIAIQNLAAAHNQDRSWFGQATHSATSRADSMAFWDVFGHPRAVFVSQQLAQREGLRPGDRFPLVIQERIQELAVAGILPARPGEPAAPATLLVMDLPAVQALTGHTGRLSRVEFLVEEGPGVAQQRTNLRRNLELSGAGRWQVFSPVDRRASAATMTRAFRINLTILSLIALLVGLYLVFQALDGAVVRRRDEIAILRSLGVEPRWIRRAWLLEAGCLGILGGGFGALLGWIGAQSSVRLVGRTVNALYYSTSVQYARLDGVEFAGAIALALASSLVAGWLPARAAARTPPAQLLVRHALAAPGSDLWRREWIGIVLIAIGFISASLPPLRFPGGVRFPLAGYIASLSWILGGGILGGWTLRILARRLQPAGKHLVALRLACSHLVRPSGRHRLAVAGLVCAVAMTAGMTILVSSFDATMRGWIERTFQADLFISSAGAQSASSENRITPDTWRRLLAHPAVAEADIVQVCEVQLPGGKTLLTGSELGVSHRHTRLAWMQPPQSEDIFDRSRNAGLALVSESFSERFQLGRGAPLAVPTPSGVRHLVIAGVFCDYGNERGSIVVDRHHFAAWFGHELASGVMVFLRDGVNVDSVRLEWARDHPGLRILGNAHLRSEILRIFRQTFAITDALEIIGVLVSVIGLGLTLGSIQLERRADLATLRALGMTRREIARATACEGLLVALAAAFAGLVVSIALGWLLIHVINKQTFGWTLSFTLPWPSMAGLAGLVAITGFGVAHGVGRWSGRLPADREE